MLHTPCDPAALQLLYDGSHALAKVQRNGMRVDVPYLQQADKQLARRIKKETSQLEEDENWKLWRKIYGSDTNIDSGAQLARILYDELGIKCKRFTETGERSTDQEALEDISVPMVRRILKIRKLNKARTTYVHNLLLESHGGYIHPSFSLNKAVTYRSSCSGPNIQNMPARGFMGRIIRRAFICRHRKGQLVEIDFSGAEVRVAACYHQDPTMLEYIHVGYDMHSAMAKECFKLTGSVPKPIRQEVKGKFVFAAFYGDWWKQIAENLWGIIDKHETSEGDSLKLHLRKKNMRTLYQFQQHIKRVYNNFWNRRFPVYTEWKREVWDMYQRQGWVQMLTGFVFQGACLRNEVINAPVQGSSFHCLLWTLIQLQREIESRGMKTLITGQVHDSIICEVYPGELPALFDLVKSIVFDALPQHWPWLIVPMEMEAEGSDINWYEKQELEF